MRVIGTAGHVDHGKSTLVKALTGIDPDRLKEEKQREMTIDLGFAWLTLPSDESIGIVDVPGHQDFIKNMLAGVGGIDAALFVIAADEGVMPQTREHLAILNLLEIPRGVIALTKIDMVEDEDWLELVEADISETMTGTVLANAPIVPVSAMTGAGINLLIETLDRILAEAPPRLNRGRPRLPIDRVFSISGFGTVVTGTLLDGQFAVGQEVEILPQGSKSRIRGIQSHKQSVASAEPGARTAINLSGVSTDEIARGNVLTSPGWLEPSQLIDVHLRLLSDSPKPLQHNQAVEVFTGSVEVSAFARLLGARQIEPGQEGWVQLRLAERIPVLKGDHFIIRRPSPSMTIGGGVVVNPLPRRRHRRFRSNLITQLETLLAGTPEELVLAELDRQGPIPARKLVAECGLTSQIAIDTIHQLFDAQQVFILADTAGSTTTGQLGDLTSSKLLLGSAGGWSKLLAQFRTVLTDYHEQYPLRLLMPRSELKSRLKLDTRLFNDSVKRGEAGGTLVATETGVRLASHQVEFTITQKKSIDDLLSQLKRAPYNTPLPREMATSVGDEVFMALIEGEQLTRLSNEVVLLTETYREFVRWLKEYLAGHAAVTVAEVRDKFNTSRKYALALLEYTDKQRITKRVDDQRVLR
jgi:selenocysteine-specific elongation factor